MMSDEDIKEYHNIGRAIKHSDKYTYVDASRIEDQGTRLYDVNGARLPSVTMILNNTSLFVPSPSINFAGPTHYP